ncbi:MAG: hypothetical protein EAZ77_09110 [Nostocales cyanobacterium]|nr:MAG: hypothetical protein EAZ77_09110 [Nostocales cyanobacterium]
MITKSRISQFENLNSSRKIRDQDNIIAFTSSRITENADRKVNKSNSESSSYKQDVDIANSMDYFTERNYDTSRQIKNDTRRPQSIFSNGEFLSSILIQDYFQSHPNNRKALAQKVARQITSVKLVLEVLDLGTSRKIREGFDATVMLLAECKNALISTLNHLSKPNPDNKDLLVLEEKWEILITSIACSSNIPAHKRFDAIVKLIPDSNRRSVKTAIIDALLIMDDEVDIQSIKSQLEYFLSDSEHDEYVKEYAKEAMQDM